MGIRKASKAKINDVLFRVPFYRYFSTRYTEMFITLAYLLRQTRLKNLEFSTKNTRLYEEVEVLPRKPKRPCSYPGCPRLTEGRFCEEHQREENKRYEKYDRDPAVRRRYGRVWKRVRDSYVKEHPFCEECFKKEILVPVEE